MEGDNTAPEFAIGYLDGIKKEYKKMKESCTLFEQEQKSFIAQIGLDLDAFNISIHPEFPAQEVFQLVKVSERDQQKLAGYLSKREKMYLLEQCVRSIIDDDNIMIERWFRSLKTEKLYVEEFETERELKACIEDYISQYNTVRPHMALGYETPAAVFAASFSICA